MSDIVSAILVPRFTLLSTSSRRMSLPITPSDASRQARIHCVEGIDTQLKAFTGVPANSLTAAQCKSWLQFLDDKHTRRVRVFLKAIARDDVTDIQDALVDLCNHYTVRFALIGGLFAALIPFAQAFESFVTKLENSGQVNPALDSLVSVFLNAMTLVHEAFPGEIDPNSYNIWKRYGAFHKARRVVEAELKAAKQKEELAKKEAEARAKVLKVRSSTTFLRLR